MHGSRSKISSKKILVRQRYAEGFNSGVKGLITFNTPVMCMLSTDPSTSIVHTQGDQKVSVHLMITVQQNTQKYFKDFQSLTVIT
jgi:hypothetical protein